MCCKFSLGFEINACTHRPSQLHSGLTESESVASGVCTHKLYIPPKHDISTADIFASRDLRSESEREIMCESELSLSLVIAAFSSTLFEDVILKFSPIKSGMNPKKL